MAAKHWNEHWDLVQLPDRVKARSGRLPGTYRLYRLQELKSIQARLSFYRDVSQYRKLDHPALPLLVDSNASDFADLTHVPYTVFETIEGCTLKQYVETHTPLTFKDAGQLCMRLLDLLRYCHGRDVPHGCIRPENVILPEESVQRPTLVNFGSSFNTHATSFIDLPEQRCLDRLDARSDLTAIAGLLFYMMTGMAPGALENCTRSLAPTVFHRAFKINLGDRFQTARDLQASLADVISGPAEQPLVPFKVIPLVTTPVRPSVLACITCFGCKLEVPLSGTTRPAGASHLERYCTRCSTNLGLR